jgi:hypothetical protein
VVAWLGVLKGGGIAVRAVQELQREFDTEREQATGDDMSIKAEYTLDSITRAVIDELLSDGSEVKYEALGNIFRSEL